MAGKGASSRSSSSFLMLPQHVGDKIDEGGGGTSFAFLGRKGVLSISSSSLSILPQYVEGKFGMRRRGGTATTFLAMRQAMRRVSASTSLMDKELRETSSFSLLGVGEVMLPSSSS